jgi:hypothetical protein
MWCAWADCDGEGLGDIRRFAKTSKFAFAFVQTYEAVKGEG